MALLFSFLHYKKNGFWQQYVSLVKILLATISAFWQQHGIIMKSLVTEGFGQDFVF